MKFFALIAAAQAGELFLQLNDCNTSDVADVTCYPAKEMLFATGMNGDEDLDQWITMKGQKFHYAQEPELVQYDSSVPNYAGPAGYDAKGIQPIPYPAQDAKEGKPAKDWNKGYAAPEQVDPMDPKIDKKHTTFYLG